jgi:AcrR family transcriptional regulator
VVAVTATRWTTVATIPRTRRTPVQRRSRERVERILEAAEQLVVSAGAEALSTRAVAERAEIPVATLYQYFADRDAIIAALIERHVSSMDEHIGGALADLDNYRVRSIIETTVGAYRADYRKRPSYVVLWFQGRLTEDIADFIRTRDNQLADAFHSFATGIGLLAPDTDPLVVRLCFEIADRFLEVAYRNDLEGDDRIVREGIEMIVAHIERHATPAGRRGIDAASVATRWSLA